MVVILRGGKWFEKSSIFDFKSKRFISFIDFRFLNNKNFSRKPGSLVSTKKSDIYTFFRHSKIYPFLAGKRFGVYTGKNFHSFITNINICGSSLAKFVPTVKMPRMSMKLKQKLKIKSRKKLGF